MLFGEQVSVLQFRPLPAFRFILMKDQDVHFNRV